MIFSIKKYLPCLLLPVCVLASCKKEFSIPLPGAETLPVLNTLINEDSLVYVRLSLASRPESGAVWGIFPEPDSAEVQLFEDGVFKETLHVVYTELLGVEQKYYVSNTAAVKGRQYRVVARVPGYETAEGADIIPDRNSFDMTDRNIYTSMNGDGYPQTNLNFTLAHNGTAKGYYRFVVYSFQRVPLTIVGNDTTWQIFKQVAYFKFRNEEGGLFGGSDDFTGGLLAEKITDPGERSLFTLTSEQGDIGMLDSFQVEVTQLTEASYKYLRSVKTANDNDGNPTAEKVIIYNNIRNGLGIVGGQTTKAYAFKK